MFSGKFLETEPVIHALIGFAAFCLLASSGYVLNDYLDREADRRHPKKKFRPIASGDLPIPAAGALFVACLGGGIALSYSLSPGFLTLGMVYLATTLSYSFYFKHRVLLDVLVLSSGFIWRTFAGAVAVNVYVSEWLFLCTVFGALFLGFNKRRAELLHIGAHTGTRRNLAEYSPQLLEQLQSIVTSATIITYLLYTVMGPTRGWMMLTIPFVLYGIFRYIYLVDRHGEGGAPDETLLSDGPTLVTGLLYAVVAIAVLLGNEYQLLPPLLLVD